MQTRQKCMENRQIRMQAQMSEIEKKHDKQDTAMTKNLANLRVALTDMQHAPGPMHIMETLPLTTVAALDTFFTSTNEDDQQSLVSR